MEKDDALWDGFWAGFLVVMKGLPAADEVVDIVAAVLLDVDVVSSLL